MTKYKIIGERTKDILEPVKYSFYDENQRVAVFTDLSTDIFPRDKNFLMKVARKQKEILDGNKKIKSIETNFEI